MTNEYEVKSYYTNVSSGGSTAPQTQRILWKNVPLHERCSLSDMIKLKEAFQDTHRGKLLPNEFRDMLRKSLNVEYDDEEYKLLFLKINTNRDGEIDWDELVSHLLFGFYLNDPENQRELLQLPIIGLPNVIRSQHRHPISRICFCPDVGKNRKTNYLHGVYVTGSRDGNINWWSLDMNLLRSAYSSSPHLKVRTTWVTDLVCLPDVNIVVTSSTERDLRFYDCTAKTFTLKIVIYSWEYMICTMYYQFHENINENSILVCGDVAGFVRVLTFSPILRGPFQNRPGRALIQLRHVDLQKKPQLLPEMKLVEFPRAHSDWVRQVSFYKSLHCVVSCATSPDALLMCDVAGSKTHNLFNVEKGIQCFAFDEEAHVLVTGGPDCDVRVWNPFVPSKPSVVFHGHHAGVIAVLLQNNGSRIYSVGRDRVIKVWDIHSQTCVQTYIDIPPQIGERTPLSITYNPGTRELVMGAIKIAIILLDEVLNPLHTDGFTHSRAVSKVLYNPLFKVAITCGMDSIIISWDLVTGKRNAMIREAHTRLLHGELIPVEITAACFDPGYQLLLTGARNGTLKVWNFNTGACMRNMSIEHMCEVTNVFWIEGRILAVGWNRHITEFEDSGIEGSGKSWELRHSEDVLAAAVRPPLSLVTSSYSGELIMWKLETGQPYRQFSCMDPNLRIKMSYNKRDTQRPTSPSSPASPRSGSIIRRPSMGMPRESMIEPLAAVKKAHARRVSVVPLPSHAQSMRSLAVHALIFLETRPIHMEVASLMLSLEDGNIQCWSDHSAGGYKGSFVGIHTAGDYASALATDVDNRYLITGTTAGYIKIWLMTNYLVNKQVHINMAALRLEFPFLWKDRVEGRAKRSVRDQPLPMLLSSYRAHLRSITTIAYVDERKLVLSGSSDYSVRVWRLSGEYLQTLGGEAPWTLDDTKFPPDVYKVVSSTTLKVWNHGEVSRFVPGKVEEDKLRDISALELASKTFGRPAPEPLLGTYFRLPGRPDRQHPLTLDDSLPTIPIYTHLRLASTQPVRRPPTPELVRRTRLHRTAAPRKAHFGSEAVRTISDDRLNDDQ